LKARALFDGPTLDVHLRYADIVEMSLSIWPNDAWEQIQVTKNGWAVISAKDSPVKFKRPAGMLPICYPGGIPAPT